MLVSGDFGEQATNDTTDPSTSQAEFAPTANVLKGLGWRVASEVDGSQMSPAACSPKSDDNARRSEELTEVELPAAEALELVHAWQPLTAAAADELRDSPAQPILTRRLEEALQRLNPWLDGDGLQRAMAALTRVAGTDLLDANEKVHTALTYGVTVGLTGPGGRRRNRTVRFFDFDRPANNTFEVVRQFRVRGPHQDVVADLLIRFGRS